MLLWRSTSSAPCPTCPRLPWKRGRSRCSPASSTCRAGCGPQASLPNPALDEWPTWGHVGESAATSSSTTDTTWPDRRADPVRARRAMRRHVKHGPDAMGQRAALGRAAPRCARVFDNDTTCLSKLAAHAARLVGPDRLVPERVQELALPPCLADPHPVLPGQVPIRPVPAGAALYPRRVYMDTDLQLLKPPTRSMPFNHTTVPPTRGSLLPGAADQPAARLFTQRAIVYWDEWVQARSAYSLVGPSLVIQAVQDEFHISPMTEIAEQAAREGLQRAGRELQGQCDRRV